MNDTARLMSRVDTEWLRMDADINLRIVGVWLLQSAVRYSQVARWSDGLGKPHR